MKSSISGLIFGKACGEGLFNKCMNEYCSYSGPAEGNARDCEFCGSQTIYFKKSFISPWKEESEYDTEGNSGSVGYLEVDDYYEDIPF